MRVCICVRMRGKLACASVLVGVCVCLSFAQHVQGGNFPFPVSQGEMWELWDNDGSDGYSRG